MFVLGLLLGFGARQAAAQTVPTAGTIADQSLVGGGGQFVLDLTTVFSDADGDPLRFTPESSDPTVAAAALLGASTLTVTPVAVGAATILITAADTLTDGSVKDGSVETTFLVTVTAAANTAPTATAIADQSLVVGGAQFVLDLTTAFSDADGDTLTFMAESNNEAAATVAIQGTSILTVTAVAAGASTIIVTADDGNGGVVQTTFTVTVTAAVNTAPTAGTIADQSLVVGGAQFVLDLTTAFSDADGDTLTFMAESNNEAAATATIQGTSILTVTAVAAGTSTIIVTANDSNGGVVQTTFTVTVTAMINNAPAVQAAIDDQQLSVGDVPFTTDLNAVFTDPDEGDSLSFAAESDMPEVATAGIASAATLTITPIASGTATITVTATDERDNQVQTTFQVTVNSAPTAATIADQRLDGGSVFTQDLNAVFTDPDSTDTLVFGASSSNISVAIAGISGNDTLNVFARINVDDTATITVTADDGRGGQAQTSFNVRVTATANNPPSLQSRIDSLNLVVGGDPFIADLTTLFIDPDESDSLTFAASSDMPEVATAGISGAATLTVTPLTVGAATITVTADDDRGGAASTSFAVTVGINQAPAADTTLADRQLGGGSTYEVSLTEIFSDPDGDALAFSAASSDVSVATAVIVGKSTLNVTAVGLGSATITVIAEDANGRQAQLSFAVSVSVALDTDRFTLRPNYPNPFSPSTEIEYTVPSMGGAATVRLAVYTMAGRLVRVLVNGPRVSGLHRVTWDGADAAGMLVASGVYLYRLEAEGVIEVRQMLLLK